MSAPVYIGGERVFVTEHAVLRYAERVRPGLPLKKLRAELDRLLAESAVILPIVPVWQHANWADDAGVPAGRWVMLGDDIAFPVVGVRLMTCITRCSRSEHARERRRDTRAMQALARSERGGRKGKNAREYRANRARGPVE